MWTLPQDLRFGLRMMARSPVVTAVAIASLSVGIAANTATFALLNGFMFEPFPYADQDELVLYRSLRQGDQTMDMAGGVSVATLADYVAGSPSVESAMLYDVRSVNLTGLDTPEQISLVRGSPSIFEVLGVQTFLGRGFRPEEGIEGAGRVVVLHHDYWQRRFLGDPDVLGRSITLDGAPHTIVGVLPDGFDIMPANVQAFAPTDFATERENRADRRYMAFARLRDGRSPGQAQLEAETVHGGLALEYPEALRNLNVVVLPAREFFPGPTDAQLVRILTAVTLFGLLIACANVANLLLSRAEERQKEVAVRTAMGAGRGRVLRQLMTEAVLMGAIAGGLGVVLSTWVVRWMRAAMPAQLPEAMWPELDPVVVVATLILSLLAGVVFGVAPALQSVGGNLREALGNGARGGTAGRQRKRLRNAFVAGEIAVALALLTGSGVLIQAFGRLVNDDPGFVAEGLLGFNVTVPEERYAADSEVAAYERELLRTLAEIPGAEGVAIMSTLPRDRNNLRAAYTVDGRPEPEPAERPTADLQVVNPSYFETLDVELRGGRLLTDADRADAPAVVVVSEGLAAREFPGEEAIGRSLTVRGASRQIVGVVEDIVLERIALAGRGGMQIYAPAEQLPLRAASFALRTAGDPATLAADVRRAVWAVDPEQPIDALRPLQAHIDESLAAPRALGTFLSAMGAIALALAAMGIYGVMSHSVMQQQREIGIRMALGAGRASVVGRVARSGLRLIGIGIVAGLPLAYLMFRSTLVGLNLFDTELGFGLPIALAATLIGVAILATVVPARAASGVTPVAALKE